MLVLYVTLISLNFFLSLIPIFKNWRKIENFAFAIASLSILQWMFACYMLWHSENMLFWVRMTFFLPSLFPVAMFIFITHYPKKTIRLNFLKSACLLIVACFFSLMALTDFIVIDIKSMSDVTFNYGHKIWSVYFIGFMITIFTILYRKAQVYTGQDQLKIKYIALGILLTISMAVFFNLILPLLGITNLTNIGPLSVSCLIYCSLYAMLKHELMDIKVVIGRFTSFIIITLTIVISYLTLFSFAKSNNSILYPGSIILSLVWAFYGTEAQKKIITTATQKFIKGWYDFDKEVANFSRKFETVFTIKDAYKTVESGLKKIEISTIEFILPKLKDNKLSSFYVDTIDIIEDIPLENHFIQHFAKNKTISKFKDLPKKVKEIINQTPHLSGEVFLPLYSSNELMGIIIIGQKISNAKFDSKDMSLFSTLSSQLTIVLDRIRPYEKIKEEFNANQKKLFDAERMRLRSENVESLIYTIQEYNHELNTPLQAIFTFGGKLPDTPDTKKNKEMILKASKRANDIVRTTLRLIGHKGEQELKRKEHKESLKETFDMNAVINEVINEFLFNSNIEYIKALATTPINIHAVKDDIRLAVNNLIKNACDAMSDSGKIRVRTYFENGFAHIEVKDTGTGIPKDKLKEIWEPFRSTHITKGRGLGLSIVNRLISVEHNGKVDVESTEGEGATFTISLPLVESVV